MRAPIVCNPTLGPRRGPYPFPHSTRGVAHAQPRANVLHPIRGAGKTPPRTRRVPSRWLRSNATTQPVWSRVTHRILEGFQSTPGRMPWMTTAPAWFRYPATGPDSAHSRPYQQTPVSASPFRILCSFSRPSPTALGWPPCRCPPRETPQLRHPQPLQLLQTSHEYPLPPMDSLYFAIALAARKGI